MIMYTFVRDGKVETKTFQSVPAALRAALDDIESMRADPEHIADEHGNILYTGEQIGEKFVNSEPVEDENGIPPAPTGPGLLRKIINKIKRE